MTRKFEREILANIARSEESLKAANKLVEDGFYDIGASRASGKILAGSWKDLQKYLRNI